MLPRAAPMIGDELPDASLGLGGQRCQRRPGLLDGDRAGPLAVLRLELLVGEILLAAGEARSLEPSTPNETISRL